METFTCMQTETVLVIICQICVMIYEMWHSLWNFWIMLTGWNLITVYNIYYTGRIFFTANTQTCINYRQLFGLSQPAPAASQLNRAETNSHPCLLISTETKANSFWQRCWGPTLTFSPELNCAKFLKPSFLPSLNTSLRSANHKLLLK